jgi:uncharacterized protein YjbJ (UPF0337 family)
MNDSKTEPKIETKTGAETREEPTRAEAFAKTSTAAKLSGTVNGTAGFFKNKFGQMTGNDDLQTEGLNQQLLGKAHLFVGSLREAKELLLKKGMKARTDGSAILKKHGSKVLDQAIEFVEDIKKTFL